MMIPHHEGTVDMARLVLIHRRDPMVRQLAEDIIARQAVEIAAMRGESLGCESIDLGLLANIAVDIQAAQLLGQRRAALIANVGHEHFGVFARKAANAGFANALGSAGDDADAASQSKGDRRGRF